MLRGSYSTIRLKMVMRLLEDGDTICCHADREIIVVRKLRCAEWCLQLRLKYSSDNVFN